MALALKLKQARNPPFVVNWLYLPQPASRYAGLSHWVAE